MSPSKEHKLPATSLPDISRRRFLRNASVGAAAAGVVAIGGTGVVTAISGADAAPLSSLASSGTPTMEGSGIVAHVVDAKAGTMKIFVGTKTIDYTDTNLAQQLLRAAQ
ncbi:MAG: hypothetical protein ACRDY0_01670 [Acidimicrobiales bacterium]